jgi:hypothetical protein
MDVNISLASIQKSVVNFLHRFHVMVFAFTILVGLIFIVYLLYNVILDSTKTDGLTAETTSTTFDQDTIKRINELKSRDQSDDNLDFSQGRSNPFVE